MPEQRTPIAMFTRDIRVTDEPVLAAAADADLTIPVFVRDDAITDRLGNRGRQRFLNAGVADLDESLRGQWAGVVIDGRPNRELNPLGQGARYDPHAGYLRRLVPELADLQDRGEVREPWRLPPDRCKAPNCLEPIVDLQAGRRRFLAARGGAR